MPRIWARKKLFADHKNSRKSSEKVNFAFIPWFFEKKTRWFQKSTTKLQQKCDLESGVVGVWKLIFLFFADFYTYKNIIQERTSNFENVQSLNKIWILNQQFWIRISDSNPLMKL